MKTKMIKATSIIAKILEVICAVAFLAYVVVLILTLFIPDSVSKLFELLANENRGELSVQGFDIIVMKDGQVINGATVALALAGVLSFACRTMIFRNIYLIIKTAVGKTKFSKGETPFQKVTVRMVREIGIFYILTPVLQFLVSIGCRIIMGGGIETSVHPEGVVAGLVIIALSQIFNYGEKLETEVEGLV